MSKILNNHNRRLLDEFNRNNERTDRVPFNGRRKDEYLLDRRCNLEKVVYQVCISSMEQNNDEDRIYKDFTAGNWKQGLYNDRHVSLKRSLGTKQSY